MLQIAKYLNLKVKSKYKMDFFTNCKSNLRTHYIEYIALDNDVINYLCFSLN